MNGRGSLSRFVLLVAVNFLLDSPANGGVVERPIRMVREVYPPDIEPDNDSVQPQVCIVGDVVYGADEAVPAEQACLKCRCQPPGVQCETVQCAKKPGCKAIHRPNKCCPDYQCECEHNGRIYANGEKLETHPGSECKVCYCRGGEVQCAEVSCYIRKDCEGKRVPGTCCPKYDHCPPIDAVLDRASPATEPPSKPILLDLWQETNATDVPSVPEDSNKVPDASGVATVVPSFAEIARKDGGASHPRITIQEIIPERKEIPVTAPPKIHISEPQGTLLIEEALPTGDNSSNDLNSDSEAESSEVSEVFQRPPPVLRIGDKLLFFKNGNLVPEKDSSTPDSVITVIGAEGLQRGDLEPEATEESVEVPVRNDPELKTAETSHILSLVKRKDDILTTTPTQAPSTEPEDVSTTLTSSIEEPRSSEPPPHQVTEQNPAYPPIPDAMAVGDAEGKILPEVFDFLSNGTKKNLTQSEWLKLAGPSENETLADFQAGLLPDELLSQKSPIDENYDNGTDVTEDGDYAETTAKSTESLEFDSGEQTTPKTNHSSMTSTQEEDNASVGAIDENSETSDMTLLHELGSVELTDDVGADNAMKKEVELVNVTPYELLPTPEEAKSKKAAKRDVVATGSDDDVFKDLEKELTVEPGQQAKSPEEERAEAEQVFKELLDEADSGKVAETDSVSKALADIALKGKALDANALRLVGGLLGGQRQ